MKSSVKKFTRKIKIYETELERKNSEFAKKMYRYVIGIFY